MAGYFELVDAPDGGYRVRMMDGAGNLMAISVTFPTKRAAVAGVAQAREIAGTGLIRDRSTDRTSVLEPQLPRPIRPTAAGTGHGTARTGEPVSVGKRARARR